MIFAILLVVVLLSVLYFMSRNNRKIRCLKEDYESALKGSNRELAMEKGREYYSALRRYNQLTALDELEMSKDIESMK